MEIGKGSLDLDAHHFRGLGPGEHPPILDRDLFEAVQQKLTEGRNGYRAAQARPARSRSGTTDSNVVSQWNQVPPITH